MLGNQIPRIGTLKVFCIFQMSVTNSSIPSHTASSVGIGCLTTNKKFVTRWNFWNYFLENFRIYLDLFRKKGHSTLYNGLGSSQYFTNRIYFIKNTSLHNKEFLLKNNYSRVWNVPVMTDAIVLWWIANLYIVIGMTIALSRNRKWLTIVKTRRHFKKLTKNFEVVSKIHSTETK